MVAECVVFSGASRRHQVPGPASSGARDENSGARSRRSAPSASSPSRGAEARIERGLFLNQDGLVFLKKQLERLFTGERNGSSLDLTLIMLVMHQPFAHEADLE